MPYKKDPTNPNIHHYEPEPALVDFIAWFWWNYGSAKHTAYPLDRPPYTGRFSPQDWAKMKALYRAEPLRVELTYSGLWGSYIAETKRFFNWQNPVDWDARELSLKRLRLCNELIAQGFPAKHLDHAPRPLLVTQFYYERLFVLQWRYNEDWTNPDYRAEMPILRDVTKMIFTGELDAIPKPYSDFR